MKKIIVPTGYMGSGSSAITDLLSEFKDFRNDYGTYEYVFLHCPNGVFDLEDKLLIGNNAIRSDEAIRTFEAQMNKLYDKKFWWVGNYKKIFGPKFKELTDTYIKDITQYNFKGFYYMHEEVNAKMFLKLLLLKPLKILFRNKKVKKVLKYNDGMRVSFITPQDFYNCSSKYIYSLLDVASKGNDTVIFDQLLLPHNLFRIDNYFDDRLRVIVVERDPRDVFVLNKYIWQKKQVGVPFPLDVNDFCDFYDAMRKNEKKSSSKKILRIKFEDLIYDYDNEVKKISKFLGYNEIDHINKKRIFKPEQSIRNTQIFRNDAFKNEIKIIEQKLSKYLYKFPYELNNDVNNSREFEIEGED